MGSQIHDLGEKTKYNPRNFNWHIYQLYDANNKKIRGRPQEKHGETLSVNNEKEDSQQCGGVYLFLLKFMSKPAKSYDMRGNYD